MVWMGVGAVGAAVVAARVRRAARRFTPDGVAEQVDAARCARRDAGSREAVAGREAELRHDLLGDVELDGEPPCWSSPPPVRRREASPAGPRPVTRPEDEDEDDDDDGAGTEPARPTAGPTRHPRGHMRTAEIRQRWLDFFAERGHTVVPSASLISPTRRCCSRSPAWCPSSRTCSASRRRPWPRATSVQKCVRTLDIDEVGKTTRHGTFFQMNGNFSFGDYFKEGRDQLRLGAGHHAAGRRRLRLRPGQGLGDRLPGRRRGGRLWKKIAGLPDERIQRRGKKDNYWPTGQPGPAGPCSEIYFDRGPEYGPEGGPVVDEDRYLEIWNLVFMQYAIGEVRGKDDFRDRRRAAQEEHRHRHGPRARRVPAAGRRQHVRDRRGVPGHRRRPGAPAGATAPTTTTTCGCAWSPTTCAPR